MYLLLDICHVGHDIPNAKSLTKWLQDVGVKMLQNTLI